MIRGASAVLLCCSAAFASAPNDPWLRIRSDHFELLTTAGERPGRDLVRHFEQTRSFFLQVFGLQSSGVQPARIVAFHSEKEFRPFSPNEAAAAFYHHGGEHDCIVMRSAGRELFQIATHEYTHLLIGQFGGTIPLWLNEGLAELYSTFEQSGDRIVVGRPPAGRAQELIAERWIPLDTLLTIGADSPLYNEKSHAGMFYAESWALVHMLNLDPAYRQQLHVLLDALKSANSTEAFEKAYGKSVAQVQADLEQYLTQQYLHGVVFQVKPEKIDDTPAVEPHSGMLARLALAEMVSENPAKLEQASEMYRELARDYPQRWEVEDALGRLAWRERRTREAVTHFAQAVSLGSTDARMFLDYGRALKTSSHPEECVAVLRSAVRLDGAPLEAHLELGLALVRTSAWKDAMTELSLARPIKPLQAPQYFYAMAYSAFRLGDEIAAHNYIEQGRAYAKIPEEVAALNDLSSTLGPPVAEGVLESVECQGNVARLHVRVKGETRLFLIPDLTLTRGLACGDVRDTAVRIEFQAMPAGATGADGIVRKLEVM